MAHNYNVFAVYAAPFNAPVRWSMRLPAGVEKQISLRLHSISAFFYEDIAAARRAGQSHLMTPVSDSIGRT